jgi:very-short-patch-repair endonuclease
MRQRPPLSRFRRESARRLRSSETQAERKLRRGLAAIAVPGSHFRRQAPIGPYVVDFASHRYRLVIEVDGGQHAAAAGRTRDKRKERFLRQRGYRILRFWNNEVLENLEGCLALVRQAVASTSPSTGEVGARSAPGGGDSFKTDFTPPRRAFALRASAGDPPPQGEGDREW